MSSLPVLTANKLPEAAEYALWPNFLRVLSQGSTNGLLAIGGQLGELDHNYSYLFADYFLRLPTFRPPHHTEHLCLSYKFAEPWWPTDSFFQQCLDFKVGGV